MKTRILSLLLLLCLSLQPLMAMNPIIDQAKMALRSKLMQYGSLLDYRYKNLCVKTSEEALLPIEVTTTESELPLEEVAETGIIDDEHFLIKPNSVDLVEPICQAFMETHPMLKQMLYDPLDCPYIPESERHDLKGLKELHKEQTGEDLILPQVLVLTTPEVDDDAKKALNSMVDALYKQCEVLYKKEYARIKTDMKAKLAREDVSVIKEANSALDDEYQSLWKDVDKTTHEVRQVIEEANQRFHKRENENNRNQENDYTFIIGNDTVVNSADNLVIEEATIEADKVLFAPKDVFVEHLTFKRSFTQQVLSTFCVPFTFRSSDVPGKFYVFGSYDAEQNTVNLDPYTGLIEAGKGYLFLPDQDIEQLEFTDVMVIANTLPAVPDQEGLYGALSKLIFLQDAYLMQPAADGTPKFVKADAEATLAPYQSYLWLGVETEATELKISLTNTSTGIATFDAESAQGIAPIYDLRGQRMAAPKRGEVYIQQGKKYMKY